MKSKDLLREFYYRSEYSAETDDQLGAINSAYVQIANDLDLLEIILSYMIVADDGSLAMKGISFKRNKKDFERIKEYLNENN